MNGRIEGCTEERMGTPGKVRSIFFREFPDGTARGVKPEVRAPARPIRAPYSRLYGTIGARGWPAQLNQQKFTIRAGNLARSGAGFKREIRNYSISKSKVLGLVTQSTRKSAQMGQSYTRLIASVPGFPYNSGVLASGCTELRQHMNAI
jgi:hypothetical protein